MPTILLVNDDGIYSAGLLVLKRELEKLGKVVTVAPKDKASGAGKSMTFYKLIEIENVHLSDGSEAYAVDGTPADAVILALYKILKSPPDLFVSGINLGYNVDIEDFLCSGTIGAALEAAIRHVPSISVACYVPVMGDVKSEAKVSYKELELAAVITRKTAEYVLKNDMPKGVDIISINVPKNADSKRMNVTSLSYRGYKDIYFEYEEGYGLHWGRSARDYTFYDEANSETDVYAVEKGYISITPIKLMFPHKKEGLKDLVEFLSSSDY